jgi:hypothetical protein
MVEAGIPIDLSSGRVGGIVPREATKLQDCGDMKLERIRQLRRLTREIICVATELGSVCESRSSNTLVFPARKNQIRTLPMILFGYLIAALAATK